MQTKTITALEEFVAQVLSLSSAALLGNGELGRIFFEKNEDGTNKLDGKILGGFPDSLLFRGQNQNLPLVPKIGRTKANIYFERVEAKLISEIKRRGDKLVKNSDLNDWELLVYVQHFGLATRLLDWTTNPLTALWFACQDDTQKRNAYVYVLKYSEANLLDTSKVISPFEILSTEVFKPNLNNDRIIAQNGWFTVHSLKNEKSRFIPLDEEANFKDSIWMIEIPAKYKEIILGKLDILGINQETIYPGIEGACKYVNWLNEM